MLPSIHLFNNYDGKNCSVLNIKEEKLWMKRETQLGLTYPSSLIVSGSFNAGIVHLYSFTDYLDTASSMSGIVMRIEEVWFLKLMF